MTSFLVVEHFDVVKDIITGPLLGRDKSCGGFAPVSIVGRSSRPRRCRSNFPAGSCWHQTIGFEEFLLIMAAVLAPLVGMNDQRNLGFRRHTARSQGVDCNSLSIRKRMDQPIT